MLVTFGGGTALALGLRNRAEAIWGRELEGIGGGVVIKGVILLPGAELNGQWQVQELHARHRARQFHWSLK